jgi:hypothetical protein
MDRQREENDKYFAALVRADDAVFGSPIRFNDSGDADDWEPLAVERQHPLRARKASEDAE